MTYWDDGTLQQTPPAEASKCRTCSHNDNGRCASTTRIIAGIMISKCDGYTY